MATKAGMLAAGERKWERNAQVKAAVEDVLRVHESGISYLKLAIANGVIGTGSDARLMAQGEEAFTRKRLEDAHTHRYEILDDESVLEIICHGDSLEVEFVERASTVTDPVGMMAGGPGPASVAKP